MTYFERDKRFLGYLDLHGHARRRKVFLYGNASNDFASHVQSRLYSEIMGINCPYFDVQSCNYSPLQMNSKDQNELMTKQGCGRVYSFRTSALIHSYTLELGFHSLNYLNFVSRPCLNSTSKFDGKFGLRQKDRSDTAPFPQMFTPEVFQETGVACMVSFLDCYNQNPYTRLTNQYDIQKLRVVIARDSYDNEERFKQLDPMLVKKMKNINAVVEESVYRPLLKRFSTIGTEETWSSVAPLSLATISSTVPVNSRGSAFANLSPYARHASRNIQYQSECAEDERLDTYGTGNQKSTLKSCRSIGLSPTVQQKKKPFDRNEPVRQSFARNMKDNLSTPVSAEKQREDIFAETNLSIKKPPKHLEPVVNGNKAIIRQVKIDFNPFPNFSTRVLLNNNNKQTHLPRFQSTEERVEEPKVTTDYLQNYSSLNETQKTRAVHPQFLGNTSTHRHLLPPMCSINKNKKMIAIDMISMNKKTSLSNHESHDNRFSIQLKVRKNLDQQYNFKERRLSNVSYSVPAQHDPIALETTNISLKQLKSQQQPLS